MMGRDGGSSGAEQVLDAAWGALVSTWGTIKSWFGYGPSMMDGLLTFLDEVFLPYLIGGIIPGLICGAAFYFALGPIVNAYQERRRKKLADAQKRRQVLIDRELEAYSIKDGRGGDNA